jgi:oligosaccharide repeat unit polymerase
MHPLSGVVHLAAMGSHRGYFDLLNYSSDYHVQANLVTVVGLLFLVLGSNKKTFVRSRTVSTVETPLSGRDQLIAFLFIYCLIAPLAIYGMVRVGEVAGNFENARVIELRGGTARFGFMSHWVAWVVTVSAIYVINKIQSRHSVLVLIILLCAVGAIGVSLAWAGGRSILLVMSFPIIMYAMPRLQSLRAPSIAGGALALLIYVIVISETRSSSFFSGRGVDLGNWLDWEWGRYSIIGTSAEYVRSRGFLYGETFVSGLLAVILPILSVVGVDGPSTGMLTSTNITSLMLFGNYNFIHVVPGFSAELFVNFGVVGVAAGYAVLGRASWWVDSRLHQASSAFQKIFLYYIGSLLVFRVMPTGFSSFLFYLLYSGGPLLLIVGVSWFFGKRNDKLMLVRSERRT